MVKIAIMGIRGYAGEQILRILLDHHQAEVVSLTARADKPFSVTALYPDLKGRTDLVCDNPDVDRIAKTCDVVFLALPHKVSMQVVPSLIEKGLLIVDLSADYRLSSDVYQKHYGIKHQDEGNINQAVYGLSEINRQAISKARFITNPGCYPTAALLSLIPLVKSGLNIESVFIDAKSGISGAGRNPELDLEEYVKEGDFKAYKVDSHQHAPEIEFYAFNNKKAVEFAFVPHLLPCFRGILETIYIRTDNKGAGKRAVDIYNDFYSKEPFVKVLPEGLFPCLKDVVGTNKCIIGVKERQGLLIIVSVIDNLLKGASGQAVQNMNIALGIEETMGLKA